MKAAIVALVTALALVSSVMAQSAGKVLVLPLDGNAPEAQRSALNKSVIKLAKAKMGGDVSAGETTFNETASAVGCDPALASCAEQVRTTLAVDELVYGSATTSDGTTTVTVNRVAAGSAPKTQISVISETDPAEQAESGMAPLFDAPAEEGSGSGSGSATTPPVRGRPGSGFFDTRERKLGVAFGGAGVLGLAIGFALWSSASSLQDDIDTAPRSTLAEINALKDLEDRAGSKALWGNIMVVSGVVLAGVGGYFLWKDHKNRKASVAPVPTEAGTGVTFVLRGSW
jgi:hypothetical protein